MGRLQLLAAFLLVLSVSSIAVYSSTTLSLQGNFRALTVPAVNISPSGGYVFINMNWYGGLQPYDAKVYYGSSPTCAFDTVLFNDTNDIILPPNPMGYNPNQQYDNWIYVDMANDSNSPQYDGYYCVNINDSTGNESWTSYGTYLNMSLYTTSTSTTSTTTVHTTTSITTSTISTSTILSCILGHICGNLDLGCAELGQVYNCPNEPVPNTTSTTVQTTSTTTNQVTCGCVCSGACVHPVNGSPSGHNSSTSSIPTTTAPGSTICSLPNIPFGCVWISTANSTAPCAGHLSCTSQPAGQETSASSTIEARIISEISSIISNILRFL